MLKAGVRGYAASAFVCLHGGRAGRKAGLRVLAPPSSRPFLLLRLRRGCWVFPGRMAFMHESGGGEDWAAFVFGVWWCGLAVAWG